MFDLEPHNLKIVMILTVGFAFGSLLGYITQKMRLSPLLGYLIAGYLIGPYSPGFVADAAIAEQLAEIGVILMMFGVGLHFKLEDLLRVRSIAIPGAIGQTFVAATFGAGIMVLGGWSWSAALIMGLAIGVASTVVLVRVLSDNNLLKTPQGHIAVGWLIVEDILTVIVLILLPSLAAKDGSLHLKEVIGSLLMAALNFVILVIFMFTLGRQITSFILVKIAHTRSHELLTLTVLALTFVIATGSTFLFGTSIALGAFIAGMIIGQSDVRHQATASSSPIKDVFVVIFFLSVGMLFDPAAIGKNLWLFLGILAVILIIKPLVALLIVTAQKYPRETAITVAISLAQIGEFSFILAEEALRLKLLPDAGFDILVACAFVSISLNPLLFKYLIHITPFLEKKKWISSTDMESKKGQKKAIVVGFGPLGKKCFHLLENKHYEPYVIDRNVDTITRLVGEKKRAIYGDASQQNILENAKIETADVLIITTPDVNAVKSIIQTAKEIRSEIPIIARVQFISEKPLLNEYKVRHILCDEEESLKAVDAILAIL